MVVATSAGNSSALHGLFETLFCHRQSGKAGLQSIVCSARRFEDRYARDGAVYFCDLSEHGGVEGFACLVPTMSNSLVADLYPFPSGLSVPPCSPQVYEAVRFTLSPSQLSPTAERQGRVRLLRAMIEWAWDRQLTDIQCAIDPSVLSMLREMTPKMETIGTPRAHAFAGTPDAVEGGYCLPVRWPVSDEMRMDLLDYAADQNRKGQKLALVGGRSPRERRRRALRGVHRVSQF